ncbi:AAA family ATPase [Streptomyces sp. MBT65]|uniref:nSTAND1 domain-containing NTPase n=1 Tax=Streptomyces sp. MBT65 TaxID=1488395 RepID=UPI00190B9265|nr:AAA family ATPase [Streptomyces sp. MBT65]MBK3580164.1 AAA family ATPase [Streptomyces sp. MBT65]
MGAPSDPVRQLFLGYEGTRAVVVSASPADGSADFPYRPSVHRSADALADLLVDRCGLAPDRLLRLKDPERSTDVLDPVERLAGEASGGLLFCYVGHGVQASRRRDDSLLLVTAEAARFPYGSSSLDAAALRFEQLMSALEPVGDAPLIVVLDCCFSGLPLSNGEFAGSRLHSLAGRAGRPSLLLTSADDDEQAHAPGGADHTAFTGDVISFLSKGSSDGHPLLTVGHLLAHVERPHLGGAATPQSAAHHHVAGLVLAPNPAHTAADPLADGDCEASDHGHPECPYPGLAPYDSSGVQCFFGRTEEVDELARLIVARRGQGPVLVTGPSGIGKTSLLRAGLLPALAVGKVAPETGSWHRITLTPTDRPLQALARAVLGRDAGPAAVENLAHQLAADPRTLIEALRPPAHHLLVVDQLEEIFRYRGDSETATEKAERDAFIACLVAASTMSPGGSHEPAASVVLSAQNSHLGALHDYASLRSALTLNEGMYPVPRLAADQLEEVITGPAHAAGHVIGADLLARLQADVALHRKARADFDSGVLPLLSHALRGTWEKHHGRTLRTPDYERTGGLGRSIAHAADTFYESLTGDEDRRTAREILVELVHWTGETEQTVKRLRTEVLGSYFPADRQRTFRTVLDLLKLHRLVTEDEHHVQLVHRSLLMNWSALEQWVEQLHDGEPLLRLRLERTAADWEEQRLDRLLWLGPELASARDWANRQQGRVNSTVQAFLAASADHERRRRLRTRVVSALVVLAVLIASGAGFGFKALQADRQRQREKSMQTLLADAESARAGDPALAAQLALAAYRIEHTDRTRDAVLTAASARSSVQLTARGPEITSLSFDRSGTRLVAAGGGRVRIWPLDSGGPAGPPTQLPGTSGSTSAVFSPDGKALAFNTLDGSTKEGMVQAHVTVRSTAGADRLAGQAVTSVLNAPVLGMAFRPDGRRLALNFYPGFTTVLDLTHGASLPFAWPHTLIAGDSGPIVQGGGGSWLAVGAQNGNVVVLDASGPRRALLKLHQADSPVSALAVDSGGTLLLAGHQNGTVSRWRIGDGGRTSVALPRRTAFSGKGPVVGLAFTADGKEWMAAYRDTGVRVFGTSDNRLTARVSTGDPLTTMAVSPDGRTLATASGPRLALHRLPDPIARRAPGGLTALTVRADGALVAGGGRTGPVFLWSPGPDRSLRPVGPLSYGGARPGALNALAFGGRGAALLAGGFTSGTVLLWRPAGSGTPMARLATRSSEPVVSLALSRDGTLLAAGTPHGRVYLWNLSDPGHIPDPTGVDGHSGAVTGLAFLGGTHRLAIGSDDGAVDVWSLTDWTLPALALKLAGTGSKTGRALTASADGSVLAAAGERGSVTVWDLGASAHGSPTHLDADAGSGDVIGLALGPGTRPGTRFLAALGDDGAVRLWASPHPGTWTGKGTVGDGEDRATAIGAASAGRTDLVAMTDEGRLQRWFPDADLAVAEVCTGRGASTTARLWRESFPADPPCRAGADQRPATTSSSLR